MRPNVSTSGASAKLADEQRDFKKRKHSQDYHFLLVYGISIRVTISSRRAKIMPRYRSDAYPHFVRHVHVLFPCQITSQPGQLLSGTQPRSLARPIDETTTTRPGTSLRPCSAIPSSVLDSVVIFRVRSCLSVKWSCVSTPSSIAECHWRSIDNMLGRKVFACLWMDP